MAEPKAPKAAPSPTHAGSAAGVVTLGVIAGLRYLHPDAAEPPAELIALLMLAVQFIGGIAGRILRKKGLI